MSVAIALVVPLLVALGAALGGRSAALAVRLTPWAPLALLAPLLTREHVTWPSLLLGAELGLDALTTPFALLCAVAWSVAGWFAHGSVAPSARPFWIGWSLSLAGMVLLLLAQTLATFYLGYVVVSLSAYLMIVHARSEAAWRAGRIYLVMALAGEAAILSGVLLVASAHGSVDVALSAIAAGEGAPPRPAVTWLLLAGFAVKLGIVPLHVWLPLAHPIAPVPASAILSGVIVKAGLLGWLRLAPPQGVEVDALGPILLVAGLATAFAGVLLGLTQRTLKTVLAYSTVSQMGLVLVGFAALHLAPAAGTELAPMLGLIALHHGLNKGALFVACGCAPGATRWRLALLAIPALSLAAAPLSTGFLAKEWLKRGIGAAELPGEIPLVLSLTSAGTALLMWHVWRLAARERSAEAPLHPAWVVMTLSAAVVPWGWAAANGLLVAPTPGGAWSAAWPLIVAAGVVFVVGLLRIPGLSLPEGDLVVVGERGLGLIARSARAARAMAPHLGPFGGARRGAPAGLGRVVTLVERQLREVPVAGLALLVVGALLWVALWFW